MKVCLMKFMDLDRNWEVCGFWKTEIWAGWVRFDGWKLLEKCEKPLM